MSVITLGQYLDVLKAGDNEVLKAQAITGKSREAVLAMTVPDLQRIIVDFNNKALRSVDKKLYKELKLKGKDGSTVVMGFHPNLMYMTMSEYMDVNTLLNNFPHSLASIMAVIYRPITGQLNDKYIIEDYDASKHLENAELFRQVGMDAVNGVMLFFYLLKSDLTSNTLDSLNSQTLETLTTLQTILEDTTPPIPQPTP